MPTITFLPEQKQVHVRLGTTVLAAARQARVSIRTRCGGKAACLMCKVQVEAEANGLSAPKPNEQFKLGDLLHQHIRLSCQAVCISDTTVIVPEDPLKAVIRARLAEQREEWP